VGKK